jgi:hypothetical protein
LYGVEASRRSEASVSWPAQRSAAQNSTLINPKNSNTHHCGHYPDSFQLEKQFVARLLASLCGFVYGQRRR